MKRNERRWAAISVGVLVWTIIANANVTRAAGIGWEKQGAFQTCLDAKAQAWIGAKVELVVNEDPEMGAISDMAVAQWATQALTDCAGAGSDPASELLFMKYMARWREHIYRAADEIRKRARPD